MQKLITFLVFLFIVGICIPLKVYPMYPRTLSDVYKGTEYVVYGKVIGFIEESSIVDENHPPKMNDGQVVLRVKEIIKGEVKETEICVANQNSFMCPEPFFLQEGQEVLLFLNKDRKLDLYWIYAMKYGGKEVSQESYAVFKQKLLDLAFILNIQDKSKQEEHYVNWIIGCVKEPLTYWDGIFDLLNEKESDTEDRALVSNPFVLTKEQNEILRQCLYQQKTIKTMDLRLIKYLKRDSDPELLQFVVKKMKELSQTNDADALYLDAAGIIADLSNRKDLKQLSLQIEEERLSKKGRKKIQRFKQIM